MKKLIAQGAEAKIYLVDNSAISRSASKASNLTIDERNPRDHPFKKSLIIIKDRIPKSYRLPELDEKIRKSRTRREAKILIKAKKAGVKVPEVFNTNKKGVPREKFNIEIEFIEGDKLSETLNYYEEEKQFEVMKLLGKQVALLHKNNLIHGDLTTSNVILSKKNPNNKSKITNSAIRDAGESSRKQNMRPQSPNEVFIIDFGLGFNSHKLEDKAVDLHLIKQALEAKHWQNNEGLFKHFLLGYKWKQTKEVLEQLKKVEARGRYKH